MIIYRANGTEVYEIESYNVGSKLIKKLMGDDYVIIPFVTEEPIEFKLGDYLDVYIRNGNVRYELSSPYIPTYDTNTACYRYELRLEAYYMKWKNKIVKYNPVYGGSELSFSLTSTIATHASIITSNLSALSYTYWANNSAFVVVFDDTVDLAAAKNIQYESISILDALTSIAKTYECEWWVTDNVIHFGKCQAGDNVQEVIFTLGDNISDMSKTDSGTLVPTKLYAFGSQRNLPPRYKYPENEELTKTAVVQRRLMLPTLEELTEESAALLTAEGLVLNSDGSLTVGNISAQEGLVEGVYVNEDVYPKTECEVSHVTYYEKTETEDDGTETTYTYYRIKDANGYKVSSDMRLEGQTLHIIFESGSLNGMDFEVEPNDSEEYYEIVANENYGRLLPDVNLRPKSAEDYALEGRTQEGDKFSLYNWDSSKLEQTTLIKDASNKLIEEVVKYLKKARIDPNDYTCTEDCFQNDYNIRELGDKVRLVNPAYFPNGRSSRIVGIEINLDLPYDHPKYICGEKADYIYQGNVGTTTEVFSLNGRAYQGTGTGGGGGASIYLIKLNDMTAPSDSNAYSAKRALNDFISSINEDEARGLIQFLGGLTTGNFSHGYTGASIDEDGDSEFATALIRRLINSGDFYKGQIGGSGWGIYKDSSGYSTMEVDNLIVRMKAVFAELEIRKMSYIGGDYIFSAAGSKICKVEYLDANGDVVAQTTLHALTDGEGNFLMQEDVLVVWNEETANTEDVAKFRCYLYADDGTTRTMNLWQVSDQARCQTFNIQEGVYQNVENRFYWRLVNGVGTKMLEDGHVYNYVDLSNVDYAGAANHSVDDGEPHKTLNNDFPQPGDVIVQLGSRINGNRQNAIEIVVEGENAPAIIEYKGIDDYNLASHRRTVLSPNGDEFFAKSYSLITANEVIQVPHERGQWTGNKRTKVVDGHMVQEIVYYEYYDRVSWNGSLWLMTNNQVTNIHGYSDSGYDSSGNGIVGDREYEPKDGSNYWTKQVSGGVSQSMVCTPNPVMIDTSKQRSANGSGSQAVSVECYVGGTMVDISNATVTHGSGLNWTATGVVGNGALTVTVQWNSGTIRNGVVNITATLVSGDTVNGSFVVCANVNGDNGLNAPYLVLDHDTFFIDTDANGYPLANVDDYVHAQVLVNAVPAWIDDVHMEDYEIRQGGEVMANVYVRDFYDTVDIHILWRSNYPVQNVDIPFDVDYIDASDSGLPSGNVPGLLSIRANKVGPAGRNGTNGQSAISVSVTPQVYFVPVDERNRTLTEHYETIEVRCFLGSRPVNAYDIHNVVLDGPFFIDDTANEIERVGSYTVEFATISFGVDDNAFFNSPAYLTFSVDSDYEEYQCKVTVMPLRKGDNGRGISNITVEYAITSGTDAPQASDWATDYPNVSLDNLERKYIWRRTTITYTDNSQPKITIEVIYSGGDGDNGTSFTVKGKALTHVSTTSAAIANHVNGTYLVDEDANARTAVVEVTNWSTSTITETFPSTGDAYLVEDTDHIWIATDGGWIDAGTIKGVDGLPSYIHFAWANSSDGSLGFTVVKGEGVDYAYMGVCADHTQADPGIDYHGEYDNDPTNPNAPWHAYVWNKTGEGDKGTTILGDAIAHITDETLNNNNPNNASTPFTDNGIYLLDLDEWSYNNGTWTHGNIGSGVGHKTMTKTSSSVSFADPDEADTYLVDGYLWSSIDHLWRQVSQERYNGISTFIHYAWANSSNGATDFTVVKATGVNYLYIGVCTDENEYDPGSVQDPQYGTTGYQPWTQYDWNLIKGEQGEAGSGIDRTVIEYNISQNGMTPPSSTDSYWADSIANTVSARGWSAIPDRWYVWTRTTIYFTGGLGSTVSYSVAYQGHEGRDGTSVNIKGTLNTYPDDLNDWYNDPAHEPPVFGDAWIIGGYLYMFDGEVWRNLGKFTGDDGRTTYFHIAWMNTRDNSDGSFTTEKAAAVDYYYMGTCVTFEQTDPGTGWNNGTNQYDSPHTGPANPWTLYDWNLIKGAEGTKGTAVKGNIIAHLTSQQTATEAGLYAVDEYKGTDSTPARNHPALANYSTSTPHWSIQATNYDTQVENDIVEGESYIDGNGHLWSYIENVWEDLGQYVGSSTYLHLAWANSPDGSSGFTTSKTAFVDYSYVGFCSDENEDDPGHDYNDSNSPNYHQGTPWTSYNWKRLRGLSPAVIHTQTDQIVVDADYEGKILNIAQVTGYPVMVALMVDDTFVPSRNWTSAKITLVFADDSEIIYPIDNDSLMNVPSPNDGLYITHWNRYDDAGDGNNGDMPRIRLYWAYRMTQQDEHPPINLRQVKFAITADYQGSTYMANKSISVQVIKQGEKSGLIVEYSAGPTGMNGEFLDEDWDDIFDPTIHKWMRISVDGGNTWSDAMKIVADQMELNVKGKALYHVAAVSNAQQRVSNDQTLIGQGKWGLVDSYTQSGQTKYSGVIEFSSLSSYVIAEADIGDGYILNDESSNANGHLFLATNDGWSDAGQISGEKGADAIFAMLNPPNAIAQQLTDAADSGLTPITTSVIVTRGGTPIPFGSGGFSLTKSGTQNCNASIDPSTGLITVTALTHQQAVSNGLSSSFYYVPYDHGTVNIRVNYQGYQADLVFQWYANLLGTWKQTIQGDINRAVANKVSYRRNQTTKEIECIDDNGQFLFSATNVNFYVQELINGKYVGSSTYNQDYQSISQRVENAEGDIAEIMVKADSITSTVNSVKIGTANMFNFTECNFASNCIPYIQGYGVECKSTLARISKLGTNSIGGDFVVSCEMRMKSSATSVYVNMCDVNPTKGLGSVPLDAPNNGAFTLGTAWERKVFVFSIPNNNSYIHPTGTHTYNGFLDFEGNSVTDSNRIYVRNLQVERGSVETAFSPSEKDVKAYNCNDILTLTPNQVLTKESDKYKGYDVYKLPSGSFGTGNVDLFTNGDGRTLTTNKVYTLSFYAKGNGVMIGNFFYSNTVDGTISAPASLSGLATSLRAEEMTTLNQNDGATYIKLSSAYKRYTIHWYNQSSSTRHIILGRVNSSWQATAADVYITGIEFREGYWTDEQMESQSMIQQTADRITMTVENLGDDLSTQITQTASQIELNVKNGLNSTGINIEDGSITLNADKTTVVGDLELHDQEQGLVLYNGGNVAKVSVKSDTLGNLDPTGFGTVIFDHKSSIVDNGAASFNFSLGNVAVGEKIELTSIRVNHGLANVSGSVRYSYSLKVGGSAKSSSSGQVDVGVYGFNVPVPAEITSNASGALTFELSITNATMLNTRELNGTVYARTTATGLNKIGADGAVFANSQTHYNWFGSDKTEIRNGDTAISLDGNGAWYSPYSASQKMELGSCTTVAFVSRNDSGVNSLGNNTYEWFAPLSAGVIVISENYTFHIYLPQCHNCRGKIYYVKRLTGNVTVFMNNSQGNSYMIPSDSGASDATDRISIGSRATMFVSIYDYWLEFDCS